MNTFLEDKFPEGEINDGTVTQGHVLPTSEELDTKIAELDAIDNSAPVPTLVETFDPIPAITDPNHDPLPPTALDSDPMIDGSTLEEISEMFEQVMTDNPNAAGELSKQHFTDDHIQKAQAYDVEARKKIVSDMIEVAANEIQKLCAVSHEHLAHEWNKSIILENTDQQTILQAATGPAWHQKAVDHFRDGLLALRRAVHTDTRF